MHRRLATMLGLNERRRTIITEKAPDLANGFAVAAIFGQFLTGQPYSVALAVDGAVIWLLLWGLALGIAKDGEP